MLTQILFLVRSNSVCVFPLTQPEPSQATQVSPGQRGQRAPMLHFGEVEDEGDEGDEDEIEDTHGREEVSHLTQVGTAQEHLKQYLQQRKQCPDMLY